MLIMKDNQYPEKFDLNDLSLSGLFANVAIYLDLHSKGQTDKLNEEDYGAISLASKILKDKSREFRINPEGNLEDTLFFWKFYDQKETMRDKSTKLSADNLAILSEELEMIKKLPLERIVKLMHTCVKLSKETGDYWLERNPTGFKKYAQH